MLDELGDIKLTLHNGKVITLPYSKHLDGIQNTYNHVIGIIPSIATVLSNAKAGSFYRIDLSKLTLNY